MNSNDISGRRIVAAMAMAGILMAGCGGRESTATVPGAVMAPSAADIANCEKRVNDTPAKLEPCVASPSLWQRLSQFQTIANKNPGPLGHPSRQAGTPGYKASVDYVAGLMQSAGYKVKVQTYKYNLFADAGVTPRAFFGQARPKYYPYKGTDYNVIADSPYGDPHRTVVIEGHLDSFWGAGMLDNASGSTTILQVALALAKTPTHNHLRFIWFGGEELGLLGSRYYTQKLSASELGDLLFDVDVDVSASPNFDILIADTSYGLDASRFPASVIPASKVGSDAFVRYFDSIGVTAKPYWYGNTGTDSNSFALVGIPNTGILTMQDCCKQPWEVQLWGGYVGDYEGVVPGVSGACADRPLRWCDNLSNNNPFVFKMVSKAVGNVTLELANNANIHR
ncbi:MAG: M28 family peptidase [Candidatus Eremiobacteraeota bacterium]|nr:M28 family peptidase [Candidatus Eremiobacteraeota bacterium]